MIRVYLQRGFDNTGKGKFLQRLAKASVGLGVEYTEDPKGCDALLDLAWWHGKEKGLPRVLRVDGASSKSEGLIRPAIKKADAVIWQSQYCKEHFAIPAKKEYLIYNGADPDDYNNPMPGLTGYNVIISGKWLKDGNPRKEKKLAFMLQVAIECVKKHDDVFFWVAGDVGTDNLPRHKRITYLGWLGDDVLSRYIAGCQMMLNLSEHDWCPNAVVECLVAGMPVMYSAYGGGIPELVKGCGWCISEIMYAPIVDMIGEKRTLTFSRPDLYIENTAAQYKRVFEEVIHEKVS